MNKQLRNHFESILNIFYEKANKYKDYPKVILGTGLTAELYNNSFDFENIIPNFYIEDFKSISEFHNRPVIKLNQFLEINKKEKHVVLAACLGEVSAKNMDKMLTEKNIEHINADAYILGIHKDEVLQVFDWLEDELSQITYYSMIIRRMGSTPFCLDSEYTFSINESYLAFPEFRKVDDSETIVDVGAYVGDSIEASIWKRQGKFNKIYAFEPDKNNLRALEKRIARLTQEWELDSSKFVILPYGVSDKKTEIYIEKNETDSSNSSFRIVQTNNKNNDSLKITTIDDYFKNKKISILKADIESMEYKMLLGASETIKRDNCKVSICIYHNPSDMYRIAHLLKSYNSNYKLGVRQHYDGLTETVLYCY